MKLQLKFNTRANPGMKDELNHILTFSLEENSGKKEIIIENQEDWNKETNSLYFLNSEEVDAIIDFLSSSKVKINQHQEKQKGNSKNIKDEDLK